jgi:glycopeptide antibiotics resistance protein
LTIKYLLGIAPNFFPAIGIPALFIVIIPQMKWTNKWLNEKKYITANLISLAGLLSWEFLQTLTTRGHFDCNDILWTLIGAFVFQLIWTITPTRYKEKYDEA